MAGDTETGVTIMRVVKALDAGPMLARTTVPIGPDDTTTMVEGVLAERGAELLVRTLDAIDRGGVVETPQDESQVTYAPKLTKAEGVVDWRWSAQRIHNLVRGLWPWPHASTWADTTRYIIHRSRLSDRQRPDAAPGTILAASSAEGLKVATGDGVLELVEIQLEGKRVVRAREALAGLPLHPGSRFGTP